jgi:short-subunit dehydrogenase
VLLPKMVARREGDIINIGSLAGRNPFVGGACYGATKHAVVGFSESLMLEVRDAGVRVAMVMPGSVDTHFGSPKSDTSWMLTAEQVASAVAMILETPRSELISRIEMRPAMPRSHR